MAAISDPGANVGNQVGVNPVDNAGINVSHLKQGGHLGIPGTAIDPDHICHPPGPIRVGDDHRHSRHHVQKDRIRFGCCDAARVVNRHTSFASTDVLTGES